LLETNLQRVNRGSRGSTDATPGKDREGLFTCALIDKNTDHKRKARRITEECTRSNHHPANGIAKPPHASTAQPDSAPT
jgi:hypothetical protein